MSLPPLSVKGDGGNPVSNGSSDATGNNLLSRLPASELSALVELSKHVQCGLRDILSANGKNIEYVYFPLTGMISVVTELKDGTHIEAMTIGREGFAGLPLFHGVNTAISKSMCQIEGMFLQVPADSFTDLLPDLPQLSALLHRYAQFAYEVVAQTAACNSMHLIEQRCARWLLISSDAVGKNELGLTHDFLSQMLAVRRPGVTVAIGALERLNLIEHRYGKISILDKVGLEKVSCECYRTVKDREQELLS